MNACGDDSHREKGIWKTMGKANTEVLSFSAVTVKCSSRLLQHSLTLQTDGWLGFASSDEEGAVL